MKLIVVGALVLVLAGCASGPVVPMPVPTESGSASTSAMPASPAPVAGKVLPNPALTPGDINTSVTQATIASTICVSGWTATIRPPSSVTTALKVQQLGSGYNFGGDINVKDYEEDHLIPLELGGSSSPLNLWPEPYTGGAHLKDSLENKLKSLVCAGTLPLDTARKAISTNWIQAYATY